MVIPNGALILESGFYYKINPKSHLKATVYTQRSFSEVV